MIADLPQKPTNDLLRWTIALAKTQVIRPISRWVEDEIVLPNGPHAHKRYRHYRHPVSRLWFELLDKEKWSRYAASGPTQNGKSLMCYLLVVLYRIFELKETVVIGLPDMKMANDKWAEDFLPIILASRFAHLLPDRGEGSRGGAVKRAITFKNGATMRFMTGGGNDKTVAGFTARVVAITEIDGMDEPGESSRESDRITQIEGRSLAFNDSKRVYLECTVSIERGRIWQEIKNGTDSRIVRPCPYCKMLVSPEREHLIGWKDCATEAEARKNATWSCPECAHPWTEDDRHSSAEKAMIVHKGQEVTPDGEIVGEPIDTDTLGFRWSAIDNPFATAAQIGVKEWKALHSKDKDNAEKAMRQQIWCIPYVPPEIDVTPLDMEEIQQRKSGLKRGIVPDDCIGIAVATDTGKRKLHWTAMALRANGSKAIIEYGMQETNADAIGMSKGLKEALRKLRTYWEKGWTTSAGRRWIPSQVWIDSGYFEHTDPVYEFCQEANAGIPMGRDRYRPSKGYGEGQRMIGRYVTPHASAVHVGKQFHIAGVRRAGVMLPGVLLVHVNSDHWKSEFHQGLAVGPETVGAITLWDAASYAEHEEWASHIVAEKQVEKNGAIVWERITRNNHQLDAGYNATCACEFIRELHERSTKPTKQHKQPDNSQPFDPGTKPFLASLR